jgi:hypothetical protein
MGQVTFRPELKTAGGETMDIFYNDKLVGSMTLLYREGDRLTGSVQLNQAALPKSASSKAIRQIQHYVESLIDALAVPFCQVTVTYSQIDHVIATEAHVGKVNEIITEEKDSDRFIKRKKDRQPVADDLLIEEDVTEFERPLELVIVGEGRNRVEYHVYDAKQQLIAEAFMRLRQGDVSGEVTWYLAPTTEEIDEVTELLVSDFDPEEVDTFSIAMHFEEEEVAHIELTHEDFFDEEEQDETVIELDDSIDLQLIRDDGDSITYEIFSEGPDSEQIGTATVDITGRQISSYIDFAYPGNKEERETIATALMREVDKEREYDTFNVTMLYHDELIDEIAFDQREVH